MSWSKICLYCYFNIFVEKKCFSVVEQFLIKLRLWEEFEIVFIVPSQLWKRNALLVLVKEKIITSLFTG